MKTPDWEKIYEIMDGGEMKGCRKGDCLDPCCDGSGMDVGDGSILRYSAPFYDRSEYDYQRGLVPSFDESGVKVDEVVIRRKPKVCGGIIVETYYLINECMNDDGTCRFEGRKPFVCQMFPFTPHCDESINTSRPCLYTEEIFGSGGELLRRIMEVRKLLGLRDSVRWILNARNAIRELREQR